jgi:hypothetical protein
VESGKKTIKNIQAGDKIATKPFFIKTMEAVNDFRFHMKNGCFLFEGEILKEKL